MSNDEVWVAGEFSKAGAQALVRLQRQGDDWVTTALVLVSDEINSQTLKGVPISLIPMALRTDPTYRSTVLNTQNPQMQALTAQIADAMASATVAKPTEWQPVERPQLHRPDGSDPDGHSRAVAAAYREAVQMGRAPGPAIAEEAGVPVATARGWIQEARRRGHLAKGMKGRAGG